MADIYANVPMFYADGSDRSAVATDIIDARTADASSFNDQGFTFERSESAVSDWASTDEIDRINGPECAEMAKRLTGADKTIVYPALARNPAAAATEADYAPIQFVHSDFTHDYRGMLIEPDRPYAKFITERIRNNGLPPDVVRNASRMALVQFWRNVGPREADNPLAVCDCRDIGDDRLQPFVVPEYGSERLEFETFAFAPPPNGHVDRWYTWPQMTTDEVLIFRTYDSARADAGLPFWTPHSAFRDPNVPGGPEHRRASVEMRVLCLWD